MLVGVKCGCQQRGTIHVHKVLVTTDVVGVAVGVGSGSGWEVLQRVDAHQVLLLSQTLVQLEVKPSHTAVNEADELPKRKYTLNIQGPKVCNLVAWCI